MRGCAAVAALAAAAAAQPPPVPTPAVVPDTAIEVITRSEIDGDEGAYSAVFDCFFKVTPATVPGLLYYDIGFYSVPGYNKTVLAFRNGWRDPSDWWEHIDETMPCVRQLDPVSYNKIRSAIVTAPPGDHPTLDRLNVSTRYIFDPAESFVRTGGVSGNPLFISVNRFWDIIDLDSFDHAIDEINAKAQTASGVYRFTVSYLNDTSCAAGGSALGRSFGGTLGGGAAVVREQYTDAASLKKLEDALNLQHLYAGLPAKPSLTQVFAPEAEMPVVRATMAPICGPLSGCEFYVLDPRGVAA